MVSGRPVVTPLDGPDTTLFIPPHPSVGGTGALTVCRVGPKGNGASEPLKRRPFPMPPRTANSCLGPLQIHMSPHMLAPRLWSHDARVGEIWDPSVLKLDMSWKPEANDETGHEQTPQATGDGHSDQAGDKRPSWVAILPSRAQGSPSLDADINCTAVASYLPTLRRLAARHHLAISPATVPLHARSVCP